MTQTPSEQTPQPPPWRIWLLFGVLIALAIPIHQLGSLGSHWRSYAILHGVMWVAVLITLWKRNFFAIDARAVLLLAVILRLLYLPTPPSNDIARYLWEGRVQHTGVNPYSLPPQHHSLIPLREDPVWEQINHKDKTAIYPPGFMLLAKGLTSAPITPFQMNLFFLLIDVVNVALLLRLLALRQRAPIWALLYAANPNVLLAFAGEAHLDALMICAILMTLLAFAHQQWRRMFLMLALAVHMKYFAILLLPFLLRRFNIRRLGWFALPAILPFFAYTPMADIFTSLNTFGHEMHFNSSLHALLGGHLDDYALAAHRCLLGFILLFACLRLKTPDPFTGGALIMTALLLCSPNVHIWYLTWLAPFLAFYPLRSGLLWMGTIALAYHAPGLAFAEGAWREVNTLTILAYVPVYIGLAIDIVRGPPGHPQRDLPPLNPHAVSIIIPTLNEVERIDEFIDQLRSLSPAPEHILFADGGSSDDTPRRIQAAGYTLIKTPPGRGTQIYTALPKATGETVLILHVDMTLPSDLLNSITEGLNRSGALGGAAGCRYRSSRVFLKGIALANGIRANWFGVGFGDQALFFRRDCLEEIGGFPDLPLMEDVELSLRIREHGSFHYLNHPVSVSDRQWRSQPSIRHTLLVMTLLIRYSVRRLWGSALPSVQDLYNAYYPKKHTPEAVAAGGTDDRPPAGRMS